MTVVNRANAGNTTCEQAQTAAEKHGENKKAGATLAALFGTFVAIGPSTFGGGYAMIPLIERKVAEQRGWLTAEQMSDVVSVAGSAPGGIGVNAAALIGYRLAGVIGAAVSVTAITLPTFAIVLAFGIGLAAFRDNKIVGAAFEGVHAAIIALILIAAYRMGKTAIFDKTTLLIAIATVLVLIDFQLHPLWLIGAGLVAGFLLPSHKARHPAAVDVVGRGETAPGGAVRPGGAAQAAEHYFGDGI